MTGGAPYHDILTWAPYLPATTKYLAKCRYTSPNANAPMVPFKVGRSPKLVKLLASFQSVYTLPVPMLGQNLRCHLMIPIFSVPVRMENRCGRTGKQESKHSGHSELNTPIYNFSQFQPVYRRNRAVNVELAPNTAIGVQHYKGMYSQLTSDHITLHVS